MADGDVFGSGFAAGPGDNAAILGPGDLPPPTSSYSFGNAGGASAAQPAAEGDNGAAEVATPQQPANRSFGSGLTFGPRYTPPDPQASALDQTADTLQQRVARANQIASNPLAQFFAPEQVQAARAFVPQATEQLQKIRQQKADMAANRVQADTLGLAPGEVSDEASQADRVEVARSRALNGDLRVFKGLQVVDPKAAEAIQDQVHEAVSNHLNNAQLAFDSLAGMQNQGQYSAKLNELRQKGVLTDLEALGLKVPPTFDAFNATKGREGQALREARISVEDTRNKLQDRNTYQPMEKKEAETYNGRMTTAYGDQITNGTWSRNASSGVRGLVVNGAADPRDLGKSFTLASPDQRKELTEESDKIVPKEEREKYRAFNRTYQLATTDAKGNKLPEGAVNTNPNVQQGMAEGLASMLRGGAGGANIGLLKIETNKRGFIQGLIDKISTEKGAAMNELKGQDVAPYLSKLTQGQIRDVMDVLKQYNDTSIGDRTSKVAERAGALGLDAAAIGYGDKETAGTINDAIERGRQAQIARMWPQHASLNGGDGVFQIGAQRPGAGATGMPAGTQPTTQLPGVQPLQTPVQQATNPAGPSPSNSPPPSPAVPPQPQTGGGGSPITIAGQSVSAPMPPGASPNYLPAMQRIESGAEKSPWTAGTKGSSASGAFQMIDSTWAANKPVGAPDRAKDATPAQQAQAVATLTAKNATKLQGAGIPVNDTNLYIAHNLGAGGAAALLRADPNADARSIVGEAAARNNPLFFRGRPTVAVALARYGQQMNAPAVPNVTAPSQSATAEPPGLMGRLRAWYAQQQGNMSQAAQDAGLPKEAADKFADTSAAGPAAVVNNAPAIGSTLGAVGGSVAGGPVGGAAGGAVGGGAGQALKDFLQGNDQSPAKIAEQTALGGVLGVAPAGRPVLGAAARVLGAGGVEAGAEAAKGGDAADITGAGVQGAVGAAGGEAFGRALGMVGHKVFSLFGADAKKAVQSAAAKFSEAEETLGKEAPKLPGANGASTPNPKYEAAEKAKAEAETVLKDAGLKPEEAAYAHKVSSEGVPKQEAEVAKPGALAEKDIGKGYQQLESEVGAKGVGAPKATPKLADGPIAAVESGKVSKDHAELAQRVENAITAPAKSWQDKWMQLKEARSDLLGAERDALSSTESGRTQTAKDMRTLADTVRKQQEKVANIVFGAKDGPAVMQRLKVLDVRYRNLMDATNNGDLARAANLPGEAGREADRKFRAFAADDPAALAAWNAMRGASAKSGNVEKDVRTLVGAEKIPVLGHAVSIVKLLSGYKQWMRERAAGSPVKFEDMVPELKAARQRTGQAMRDIGGAIGSRAATMQ